MDEENRYGNRLLHKRLLSLLTKFDTICIENGIKYTLSSGSLLGAVRHGGFIPWDDDVDITVSRENYSALKKTIHKYPEVTLSKVLWLDRFKLSSDESDDFAPTIDVFVWDNIPDQHILESLKYVSIVLSQGLFKEKPSAHHSFLERVILRFLSLVGYIIPQTIKVGLYESLSCIGNNHSSQYYGGYHDQFNALKFKYPKCFMDSIERKHFEDIEVSVMENWDDYLKLVFGDDYMIPPPEDDRMPMHARAMIIDNDDEIK